MQKFDLRILEDNFHGIYDSVPGDEIPKGFFFKVDNALCSDGKIAKVTGSTAINTAIATKPFNGFSAFEKISTSDKWLVVSINGTTNAQLYQSTGGNFTSIGSANLTNSKPVWFEVANNILFGFNGTEEVDWDGTTVTKNRAGLPLAFFAKWFHNYLFAANVTSTPNRIFWSTLGDPTAFNTGTDFVDVNPGDSDSIQGLVGFPGQDELLIFKRNTIWSITGFSGTTFSATTIATQNTNNRIVGYGTIAPFSIVPVGNEVYFFSMLGNIPVIRSLTKTINAVTLGGGIISDNIKTTMASINLSALSVISGGFDGRYVYWGVPTGSSSVNNLVIVLDTWEIESGKGIYPFTTMSQKNASYFAQSTIPGHPNMYFTDSASTGLVFKFDSSVYTDNGVSITMDVQTRDYSKGASRQVKWKYLYTTYDTGSAASVAVNARIDRATNFTNQDNISMQGNSPPLGSFILGISLLGGQGTSVTRTILAQVHGHYMGLEYKDTTSSSVVLHKWEIWGNQHGLRGH